MAIARREREPVRVLRIPVKDFMERKWLYKPGEHCTFIGKTQSGKTTLAMGLMGDVITPEMPGIVLVMKPEDETPTKWGKRLDLRRVAEWPPPPQHTNKHSPWRSRGWLVWPKVGSITQDRLTLKRVFHKVFAESYAHTRKSKPRCVFADEVVAIANPKFLGLENDLNLIWMQGSGMGLGLWAACQRPFDAPLNAYEQSVHLFIWRSTDQRNRKRFSEIGGIDADVIDSIVTRLQKYECLYIRRTDYTYCVIGP